MDRGSVSRVRARTLQRQAMFEAVSKRKRQTLPSDLNSLKPPPIPPKPKRINQDLKPPIPPKPKRPYQDLSASVRSTRFAPTLYRVSNIEVCDCKVLKNIKSSTFFENT